MEHKRTSLVFRRTEVKKLPQKIDALQQDQRPQISEKMRKVIGRIRDRYSQKSRIPLLEQIERELKLEERKGKIVKEFLVKGEGFDSKTTNEERTNQISVKVGEIEHCIVPITKENRIIVARDILREMGEDAFFCYGFRAEEFDPLILVRSAKEWKIGFEEKRSDYIEIVNDIGIQALCKMEAGANLFFEAREEIRRRKKVCAKSRFAGHLIFEGSNLWPCDRWSKIRSRYERLLANMFFDEERVIRSTIERNVPRCLAEKTIIRITPKGAKIKLPEGALKEEIEEKIAKEFQVLRHFGMHYHSKEECTKIN